MAKVPFSVSSYDVEHVLLTKGLSIDKISESDLKDILHYVGMDAKHVEVEEVLHRPKYSANNSPWFGKRWVGFERQDREWMRSAKCTLENVIAAQDDVDHKRDLIMMSARSNNTLDICSAMEDHKPMNPEISS